MGNNDPTEKTSLDRHLDEETIIDYVRGKLESQVLHGWDRHLDTCSDCRQLLAEIAKSGVIDEAEDDHVLGFDDVTKATTTSDSNAVDSGLFAAGELVDHFKIIRTIGRGGMGEVFLARDTQLGRKVALKVILSRHLGSKRIKDRFLFEARATANFNHPHIVAIYGVGEVGDRPYVALEYLEGDSLRTRLEGERLSVWTTLRIAQAISAALCEAHAHDILHRDLKPENVVLASDGRLRVVDFGLAQAISRDRETKSKQDADLLTRRPTNVAPLPHAEQLGGTPAYMSPEQWRGDGDTEAADIWALGVILYEMVTGHRPYAERSQTADSLRRDVLATSPVPTLEDVRILPARLPALIYRCLDKDPEKRPSATEVQDELTELLAIRRTRAESGENPFRGLLPFHEDHAANFFGRDAEIDALVERVRTAAAVCVIGPSGVGKSSLVRAGVIPRLRDAGAWTVIDVRPDRFPNRALRRALDAATSSGGGVESVRSGEGETKLLVDDDTKLPHEPLSIELARIAKETNTRVLLLVDQLDELFVHVADEAARRRFVREIEHAADDRLGPVRVIFTLRDDALGHLAETFRVQPHIVVLKDPPPHAMLRAIEQPVEAAAHRFEDRQLAKTIVEESGSLPLLQLTAQALWERRDHKQQLLTHAAYRALGGVSGALASHAETVIHGLPDPDVESARRILVKLVDGDGNLQALPRSTLLDGIDPNGARVVDALIAGRLINVRRRELSLTNAVLTTGWPRFVGWLEARALADASSDQTKLRPIPTRALTTKSLIMVAAVVALVSVAATLALRTMLAPAPLGDVENERAAVYERQADAAIANGDIRQAKRHLRQTLELVDTPRARAMWIQADQSARRWSVSTGAPVHAATTLADGRWATIGEDTLLHVFDLASGDVQRLPGPHGRYVDVTCCSAGRLAVAQADGAVVFIDPKTEAQETTDGRPGAKLRLAMTSNGEHYVVGGADGSVTIFRAADGAVVHTIAHRTKVTSLTIDPSNRLVAIGLVGRTGVANGGLRIYELASGKLVSEIEANAEGISSVDFDSEANTVVTGHRDGSVRVFRLADRRLMQTLSAGRGPIRAARFSGDDRRIATGDNAGSLRLFDVTSGAELARLAAHDDEITALTFVDGGRGLVSASRDGFVRAWRPVVSGDTDAPQQHVARAVAFSRSGEFVTAPDGHDVRVREIRTGRTVRRLQGHTAEVRALAYAPRDRLVASAGEDRTVRIYDADSGRTERVLAGHKGAITDVRFAPDGASLVTASEDGTARVWRVADGAVLETVRDHSSAVSSVDFAPDGKSIVTASADGTVRRKWLDGKRRRKAAETWRGHDGPVLAVRFGSDGATVYSAGQDSTIRQWRSRTGQSTIIGRHSAPVRSIDTHGDRLVAADETGDVRLWSIAKKASVLLGRHPGGVQKVTLTDATMRVASVGDDRTLRVWDLKTQRPQWRAPALLTTPLRLVTNAGVVALDGARLFDAPPSWVVNAIAASRIAASRSDVACSADYDGRVEQWRIDGQTPDQTQKFEHPIDVGVLQGRCVVLHDAGLSYFESEAVESISHDAVAMFVDDGGIIVLERRAVVRVDASGATESATAIGAGGTSVTRVGDRIFVGYADGAVEDIRGEAILASRLRSAITKMAPGPSRTLIVGDTRGAFVVWHLDTERVLVEGRLNGAVRHVATEADKIVVASELGDYRVFDLGALSMPRCALLRDIWAQNPGATPPDPKHVCFNEHR